MSDSGDQDKQDHVMGYECPRCGAVGGHTRTIFGPQGDARNLERYCRNCNKKFITTEAEHVNNIEESEGGDTLSSQDADRKSANRSSQNNAMTKLYLYRCPACGDLSARKSKDKVNICFDHRSSKDMNYVGELKLGDSRADGE